VWQFDEVLDQPHPIEGLKELVDPRLGDNYPIDHVFKVEDYSIYSI
jgi:chitin elicitor receptor kinase 1